MPTPILTTKLYIPPTRPELVPRPRLSEQLTHGLSRKLTLVSAPAGFGKTTLISSWLNQVAQADPIQIAWLSLDEADNDPPRFMAYLVSALQTVALSQAAERTLGASILTMLHHAPPPPLEGMLTTLLNEIATISDKIVLVLDDYHRIDRPAIDEALTFLLDYLPPQLHLVITTREDPRLPLARYRVRGQLTELRATDLRFTPDEATQFFNRLISPALSAEAVAALEHRTEGWIAGLQLAALSMQGLPNRAEFIQAFTGSHHFVMDYLVEEVLRRQPARVRRFLLFTSILERLSASLCDAVTEQPDSNHLLATVERGNLFVVPLDNQRRWYRYHHLFADVLQAHLLEEHPHEIAALHRRASVWYADHDLPADAVRHALAAPDFEQAARLLELIPPEAANYQSAAWLNWAKALPDEVVRVRPVLSVAYAWAMLDNGEVEQCETRLHEAEQWLTASSTTAMIVVDEAQFQHLPASIATARAYRAMSMGEVAETIRQAQQVLESLPHGEPGEHRWRRAALALLGLTYWTGGDLEAARQAFADLTQTALQIDCILDAISTSYVLADMVLELGRLREAERVYQRIWPVTVGDGSARPLGTSDLYRGLSDIHRQRGELATAEQMLAMGEIMGEQAALTDWQSRLCLTQAQLKQSQGEFEAALDLLNQAERLSIQTPLPNVRPISAMRVRVWLAQGNLQPALAWAAEQQLSPTDDLSYLREFEHITLARLLLARQQFDQALPLLTRLLTAAEAGGRMGHVLELLILQALAHQAKGDLSATLGPLDRALALAAPEGYVRLFVDEGRPMLKLLSQPMAPGLASEYARKLRTHFPTGEAPSAPHPSPLVEALSEREREVLRLLNTDLSGPEIARNLMVSLNTMRTHTKNIYSKLGVNSRRAAVRCATAHGLL